MKRWNVAADAAAAVARPARARARARSKNRLASRGSSGGRRRRAPRWGAARSAPPPPPRECRRREDRGLRLAVAALPQLHETQIGVAQGLVGGQGDDATERRLGLGELVLLQVGQTERPRREDGGVALEARPRRGLPAAAADEEQYRDDAKTLLGIPDHGRGQHRSILAGGQGHGIWFTA